MRKKVLSIAITLPLLLALGIGSMTAARHISLEGQRFAEEILSAMRAGEPESAYQAAARLEEIWRKWETWLQLWVCHEDTDEVREKLQLVLCGLENDSRATTLENATLLREALEHLHHRDDVTWSNVF